MEDLSTSLPADSDAARQARAVIGDWADGCDEADRDDVIIAASELVNDSVRHSPPGGRVVLKLTSFGSILRVQVIDDSPSRIVSAQSESRNAVRMLDAVADDWGVSFAPTQVWFTARCAA
ncbi:transcriptional regulator [Paraconexibacter sp. AEG42_29]|uniref:Transcriptional regulator n=1 Tax=Paraconexibacter sp. AEG42_29 TaxID=2997339 RepID=A0AAU7AY74_9ACTN